MKKKRNSQTKLKRTAAVGLVVLVVGLSPLTQTTTKYTAYANSNEARIAELNGQISENNKRIAELNAQGDTLANRLEATRLEVANLQKEIDANEAKAADLKSRIADAEAKLKENKSILAKSIKKLYIEGDISSLEILASSANLSDYVDKQEYRDRVKNKVAELTGEVESLKVELETKQSEVANLLRDQVGMRVDLQTKEADQANLLNQTRGEEAEYQRQVQSMNSEVARLRREQASANSSTLGPRGSISYVPSSGTANGGYPAAWQAAPYPCWGGAYYYNGSAHNCADSWGMYKKECVSYTAFKVWQSGRHMPYWGGRGNANLWPSNARRAGIPVDGNPRVGDVAISMAGYYGHAMYVERVNGDGTVLVSQYNYGVRGEYSEMTISANGLYFIHF